MPRSALLKPVFLASRNAWTVNVPVSLSDTGKRRQLFFPSKAAAIGECERLKARKDNFGTSLSSMSPARIAKAAEAYKILDPLSIDLLDAVRYHVALVKARVASLSFDEAFDRFIESKQNKTPKYRREIRYAKATFEPLLERLVCDITHSDLEPILEQYPNASRNAKLRRLRSLFNFAIKRGWMNEGSNPVSKMDFAEDGRKEVEILPVETVQRLLNHTLEHDLEFLPVYVLEFFCGIRAEGEIGRLLWEDVRIDQKMVVLRAEITKTKRKRFPDLSANALAWLERYRLIGGNMSGLVAPWVPHVRHAKHRANYRAIGLQRWVQAAARHCFCSYWLGLYRDINQLVLLSGHSNPSVMWERYHAGTTQAEAQKFWSITPPAADALNVSKIVTFGWSA